MPAERDEEHLPKHQQIRRTLAAELRDLAPHSPLPR